MFSNSGYRTTMPLNPLMNAWMMKNGGEGSSIGANSEHHLGKRTRGDLSAGEGSQVGDPKKTKMESPPAPRAYPGHYVLQPGGKWTSVDDFPVEVFDGFKLGKDAKLCDGLTPREVTSRCFKGMGQVKRYILCNLKVVSLLSSCPLDIFLGMVAGFI